MGAVRLLFWEEEHSEMMTPTIHLNGTSKGNLLHYLGEAHSAIMEAQRKLADAAPNGRDYYVQSPQALYAAQDEHSARMQKLEDVKLDLEALCEAIDRQ
jgi:hypothetical protein